MAAEIVRQPRPAGIRFGVDRVYIAYTPPRDTLDPRYDACTDHHPACDCREAEWNENQREWRGERQHIQAAFDRILAGHAVRTYGNAPECKCHGCEVARAAGFYVHTAFVPGET